MKPLLHITITQLMDQIVGEYPDNRAVCYGNRYWSYKELDQVTDQLAAGFAAYGVRKGQRVAILSENTAQGIFAFYAMLKLGAIVCMINTGLKAEELSALFELSEIDCLVIGNHYKENYFYQEYCKIEKQFPMKQIFDIGEPCSSPCISYHTLLQEGQKWMKIHSLEVLKAQVQSADPCLMLYTSGTTQKLPKAVLSSQYHLANAGVQKADSMQLTEKDILCCALQMFHIFCIDVDILAALSVGGCLALPKDLHTASILATVEKEKCTVLSAVPCMFHAMLTRPDFYQYDVSSLRTGIIGGAFCPEELFQKIEQAFGFILLPGLGQTEATAGITICELSDSLEVRSRTVGHFVHHSEGMIRSLDTGEPLPPGMTGEVCIRSTMLMMGYYRQPELTAQAIDSEGWLHTGDLGWLDSQGYLHLSGRIKELINRGGEKIIPSEIEAWLSQMKEIEECVVIGIPDSHYGEEPCACVVKKGRCHIAREEIQSFLRGKIAEYKIPRYICFFGELPKTTTGKVRKGILREMVSRQLGQEGSRNA